MDLAPLALLQSHPEPSQRLADLHNEQTLPPPEITISGILDRVASFLPPNDVACGLKLVNKATAAILRSHSVVRLSQPSSPPEFAARWGSLTALRPLTLAQRRQLLRLTAASGSQRNLQTLLHPEECCPRRDACEAVGAAGYLHLAKWLRQRWSSCDAGILKGAAGAGHMAICQWLLDSGNRDCDDRAVVDAAWAAYREKQHDLGQWLLQQLPGLEPDWCGEGVPPVNFFELYASSPENDWREEVLRLEARFGPHTEACPGAAAECPDTEERLTWLQQWGYPVDAAAVTRAAAKGNTATVRYLLTDAGVQLDQGQLAEAAQEAARGGHLAVLQLLQPLAGPWLAAVPTAPLAPVAPAGSHLAAGAEVFGCGGIGPGPVLFRCAAESGSGQLMAWLRERGCGWDASAYTGAASSGCMAAVEWLAERGCPMPVDGRPYQAARSNGDELMAACLRRLACPEHNA